MHLSIVEGKSSSYLIRWMCGEKNKMREIERVFEDPKVIAVVHDAQIVDEKLSSLDQTTFEWRNSGTGSGRI